MLTMTDLRAALTLVAEPDRAPKMAAYMKGHFPFLGVPSPARKKAQRPFLAGFKKAPGDKVIAAARSLWQQPEREFQYVGVDLLRRYVKTLAADHIEDVRTLVQTLSWWDTVDLLASRIVGPMVRAHRLESLMDAWVDDDDMWVSRTAILHQLSFGANTDAERLFRYCAARADHRDFFIRKAIGWALREYGKVAPERVVAFVSAHEAELSGLSRREALKHLGRRGP